MISSGWTTEEWAERVSEVLGSAIYVNLGVGIPGKMLPSLQDGRRFFHCENGLIGMAQGSYPDAVDANSAQIGLRRGAAIADLDVSFGIIRGGHLDATVLGAHQVAMNGDLANWSRTNDPFAGVGGAMDLAFGPITVIVVMRHTTRDGQPKLLRAVDYPLTAPATVNTVVTEYAVLETAGTSFRVLTMAPGVTRQELVDITGAPLSFAESLSV